MKSKALGLLVLLAISIAGWSWWFRSVSDESQIREQLKELGRLASYRSDEGPIAKQRAIGKMKSLFSPNVVLRVNLQGQEPYSVESRHNLMESIQQIRFAVAEIRLEFLDPKIELHPDHQGAEVVTTLSAQLGTERQQEYQEMKARFEKTDDGWIISRLETVKTWGR